MPNQITLKTRIEMEAAPVGTIMEIIGHAGSIYSYTKVASGNWVTAKYPRDEFPTQNFHFLSEYRITFKYPYIKEFVQELE